MSQTPRIKQLFLRIFNLVGPFVEFAIYCLFVVIRLIVGFLILSLPLLTLGLTYRYYKPSDWLILLFSVPPFVWAFLFGYFKEDKRMRLYWLAGIISPWYWFYLFYLSFRLDIILISIISVTSLFSIIGLFKPDIIEDDPLLSGISKIFDSIRKNLFGTNSETITKTDTKHIKSQRHFYDYG